jgi:threonine/homoserine/homoserine lactone efflux protein
MFVLIGFFVGFLAAVPPGPIGAFIISQAIKRDVRHGLIAGFTAAVLDFAYCLLALIGSLQITASVTKILPAMKVVAAVVLFVVGFRLIKQAGEFRPEESAQKTKVSARPILGIILLYVTNPSLYVFWLGVGGVVAAHRLLTAARSGHVFFALACGIGCFLWYFFLIRYISSRRRGGLQPQIFRKVLTALGAILIGFSVYTLLTLFV